MKGFNIERYHDSLRDVWDDFVERSKNGTFMLTRKFIGYHGERFKDAPPYWFLRRKSSLPFFRPTIVNKQFIPIKV